METGSAVTTSSGWSCRENASTGSLVGGEHDRLGASTPLRAPTGPTLAGRGLTRPPDRAGGVAWDRCHDPRCCWYRQSHQVVRGPWRAPL